MMRRILLNSTTQTIPGELLAGENKVIAVDDQSAVVARVLEILPDYVVMPPGKNSLTLANEIMAAVPPERWPAFLIGNPPENGRAHAPVESGSAAVSSPAILESTVDRIDCHGIQLDRSKLQASFEDNELALTLMEFSILWELMIKPGHVRTRNDLVTCCRGSRDVVGSRTIDQHIRALRKKLGPQGHLIETVRGLGYRFRDCKDVEFVDGCAAC